jgi:regulator of protease activity HflC (stomatin/prohibitin superfamily)
MSSINALFQHFADLLAPVISFIIWIFPIKIYHLHDGEAGIILTFGKVRRKNAERGPGLTICTSFEDMQSIQALGGYCDLTEQTVTTANKKVMIFNGAIIYQITSVQLAILMTEDVEELIEGVCMDSIREYARTQTMDDLQGSEKLTKGLKTKVNGILKKHGVRISNFMVTDLRPHDTTLICETIKEVASYFIK